MDCPPTWLKPGSERDARLGGHGPYPGVAAEPAIFGADADAAGQSAGFLYAPTASAALCKALSRRLAEPGLRGIVSSAAIIAGIVLRDAATGLRTAAAADQPFIRQLFKTARAGEFKAAGLPDAALDILLEQQFRAQAAGYAAQFPQALSLIVLHRDEPIGRLMLQIGRNSWHVIDVVLLPSARGRGIGTDLIGAVARAAQHQGARELNLTVLSGNAAAHRLYARLGFIETASGAHIAKSKPLGD
jgi:ribosomal protein S18 acetylase RimI-like enzyme